MPTNELDYLIVDMRGFDYEIEEAIKRLVESDPRYREQNIKRLSSILRRRAEAAALNRAIHDTHSGDCVVVYAKLPMVFADRPLSVDDLSVKKSVLKASILEAIKGAEQAGLVEKVVPQIASVDTYIRVGAPPPDRAYTPSKYVREAIQ